MKIQKGLVKDQGFPDTTCTYGTCDDGRVYYFIENGTLENGNIIASTNLKEAIGHTNSHTSLGLIDSNSNILIPFENRTIKVVGERFLLVERANPVSQNVIDAMKDRADPLAANRLVTTAANNKDMLNAKMGRDGNFVFNNQFSEATIFDIFGNQLDNDYYSYIAMDDDTIYFSKNIMDFPVVEYPMNAPFKVNPNVEEQVNNNSLDVTNTGVVQDTVDKAFVENSVQNVDINNDVTNYEEKSMSNEIPISYGVPTSGATFSNVGVDNIDIQQSINPVNEYMNEVKTSSNNDSFDDISTTGSVQTENIVSNDIAPSTVVADEEVSRIVENNSIFKEEPKSSINFGEIKNDISKNKFTDEDFERKFEQQDHDTVIENANNVMKRLIKQNKEQKDTIKDQEFKIESLEEDKKLLISQYEDITNQNEDLNRKIVKYETIIEKYAKKLNSLSEKVDNQSKTITLQQKRLDVLEPQIAGRAQLGDTVEEAMEILNDEELDNVYTKFAA